MAGEPERQALHDAAPLVPEPFWGVRSLGAPEVPRGLKRDVDALPIGELWPVAHESTREAPACPLPGTSPEDFAGSRTARNRWPQA